MSRQGCFALGGGTLAIFLLLGVLALVLSSTREPQAPRPPELAGQKVPDKPYEIRFDRKYDLHCSFYHEEPMTFRHCTIRGFTGREQESTTTEAGGGSGSFLFSSGSGSYYSGHYFERWLVIELSDGRLAYIPPNAVRYIEEEAPDARTEPTPLDGKAHGESH